MSETARLAAGAKQAFSKRSAASKKAWDKRGRKAKDAPASGGAGSGATIGGVGVAGVRKAIAVRKATAGIRAEKATPPSKQPDVDVDRDGDGVTDAARVGVPASDVPPPPKIARLPNLTKQEREVESAFADAFEKDPDGMASAYLDMVRKSDTPSKFEVDHAKNLFDAWAGKGQTPEQTAEFRSTMNTPLHGTANAIAKRAFLMHLDQMSAADKAKGMLVTVGGCGAGKGFCLKTMAKAGMSEFDTNGYGATWDSAGDQNATENPWLLAEASKRGIKATYAYVSADPEVSWAHPERGVVKRAMNPKDGRMVDAAVFADSYAIGAKNHDAFAKKYASKANFIYVTSGKEVRRVSRVPKSDLERSRRALRRFAVAAVSQMDVLPRIKRGALAGERIWGT